MRISSVGAEMRSLTYRGSELLWSGDAPWPWRAPILFPTIGRLPHDELVVHARAHHMPAHGFARHAQFKALLTAPDRCAFSLADSDQTWGNYPYAFKLRVSYRLLTAGVSLTFRVTNPGSYPLEAALGCHPGLVSPLPGGSSAGLHRIELGDLAHQPLFRASGGMLVPDSVVSVAPAVVHLGTDLLSDGALVFCSPARGGSVLYRGDGPHALRLSWRGFEYLGLWSQCTERFVCIEPWSSLPCADGYVGEWPSLPGLIRIGPGATRTFCYSISIEDGPDD